VAESRHLTSHEFAALHLTSALARFFCAPANTPQAEATAKRRLKQLGEELQKRPDAAHVLVSLLISDLGHSAKRLPEAQSIGTRHADKCRAWPDALQRLNALSPNVDLCCNKAAGEAALARQRTEMRDAAEHQNTRHAPPEEMKHRCPQGHLLLRETTRQWNCDICHNHFSTPNSFGCRRCDFDVCASCHQSTYRGVAAGGRPNGPRRFELPGMKTHLLASVGDVDAFFRLSKQDREARVERQTGDGTAGVMERLERVMELMGHDTRGSALDPSNPAATILRALVMGELEDPDAGDDDRPQGLRRLFGRGGGQARDVTSPDLLPPLAFGHTRRELWYAGLGRVGYQETIFSCFYRKAVGLGLGSVLSEFEDALMISGIPHEGAATSPQQANNSMSAQNSQADLVGTPVRDSPPATATVPDNADSSPTAIASAASGALFPPDTPMTRQRAYYFHVFPPNSTSKCCCGDIVAPSADARSTDADDDAASQATKSNEAARNLANELPTSVSFRPPELTSTARFTLLRILYTVCVAPAVDRDHTILRLTAPVIPAQAFVCHELGVRAVKAAAASALRVAVMPPQFALPQWLVEVLYHAPYLLAPAVQQQLLHFLVVGARRSLAEAVQSHSLFSSPTAGCAVAPAEWGPSSNNTFVNRPHRRRL
jgi:hypothetical protein